MLAALYGQLVPHAWRRRDPALDAYALFVERSLSMGWLDDRLTGGGLEDALVRAPGLWAMNDAGWHHPAADPEASLVSWFQVEASRVADDRPLPIRPFLRCAQDATERAGTLTLSGVELIVPVHSLDASSRPRYAPVPSMLAAGWFSEGDPNALAPVEIRLSAGQDPSVSSLAGQLGDLLDQWEQAVFHLRALAIADCKESPLVTPDDDVKERPEQGLLLSGVLAEWSCDAIGWIAEVFADVLAPFALDSPLLVTVTRA